MKCNIWWLLLLLFFRAKQIYGKPKKTTYQLQYNFFCNKRFLNARGNSVECYDAKLKSGFECHVHTELEDQSELK